MSRIRVHFDEDAMQRGLVASLRARRVDVLTLLDCGMVGKSDEEHPGHASGEGRVLYSFNIRDYNLITSGLEHSGIILASEQRYSSGEQLRRFLHLINGNSAAEILSRLEYLSNWSH